MPLTQLPDEILIQLLRYIPAEALHGSVRYTSRTFNCLVDCVLSSTAAIQEFHRQHQIFYGVGAVQLHPILDSHCLFKSCALPDQHNRRIVRASSSPLHIPLVFDSENGLPANVSGQRDSFKRTASQKSEPNDPDSVWASSKLMEIYFGHSVHTVCTSTILPIGHSVTMLVAERTTAGSRRDSCDGKASSRYVGHVDFRVLLNWILFVKMETNCQWLVAV